MPIEVIPRRGFPHQPHTAKPHTAIGSRRQVSARRRADTWTSICALFPSAPATATAAKPGVARFGSRCLVSASFSPSPWKLITVHRKIGQMVRFRCQRFVRVHRQNSSHVAAAAEPLTANENVVQGAHRNTPRASLCAVKSTLSLSFALMQISSLRPCSPVPGTAGPIGIDAALSRVHSVSRYLHPPQRYLANAWDFLSNSTAIPPSSQKQRLRRLRRGGSTAPP